MTLTQLLTRLKELHERATPGSWNGRANVQLVTETRSTLPLLLQVIETQREALENIVSWDAPGATYCRGPYVASGALARCEKVIQEGMK